MSGKIQLIIIVSLFVSRPLVAQKNAVTVKGGIASIELDGYENRGLNVETSYARELFNNFSIGLSHGYVHQENYPDFFQFTFNPVNGVPPKVDEYIKTLNMNEGMYLNWKSYDFFYLSPFLEYYFFRLLNWNIGLQGGAVVQKRNYANFTLKNFQVRNNQIVEYTPWFLIGNEWQFGGAVSLLLEKTLFNDLYLNLDMKYQYLQMKENEYGNAYGSSSFGALRIGLSKKF